MQKTIAPIQTKDFTITQEFDVWPVDASNGGVTAKFPLALGHPGESFDAEIVKVDEGAGCVSIEDDAKPKPNRPYVISSEYGRCHVVSLNGKLVPRGGA